MPSASMLLVQAGLSASLPGRPAGVLGGPRQPPPVPPQIGIPDVEAVISAESLDLRWFPVEEIPELSDEATRRLARRAREVLRSR